jgi:hypothetical protein
MPKGGDPDPVSTGDHHATMRAAVIILLYSPLNCKPAARLTAYMQHLADSTPSPHLPCAEGLSGGPHTNVSATVLHVAVQAGLQGMQVCRMVWTAAISRTPSAYGVRPTLP